MDIIFEAIDEDRPGVKWRSVYDRCWHAYSRWFLRDGLRSRPTYLASVKAIRSHMPELLPAYERIVETAGGGDLEARFLAMWCPPAYVGGCSQALLDGPPPALIRNYDYSPKLLEGTWLASRYSGRRTVAMIDCLWGVLDGINENGLAVSLSFGGRTVAGTGFGIPVVLRYILEFARDTKEAIAILKRVPIHMSYSIALLDKTGSHSTVYVNPDRDTEVVAEKVSTNHQHRVEWPRHADATRTVERRKCLNQALTRGEAAEDMLRTFLLPPVYQTNFGRGYGTLYTAIYEPQSLSAEIMWPTMRWRQSIADFHEGRHTMTFEEGVHGPAPRLKRAIPRGAL